LPGQGGGITKRRMKSHSQQTGGQYETESMETSGIGNGKTNSKDLKKCHVPFKVEANQGGSARGEKKVGVGMEKKKVEKGTVGLPNTGGGEALGLAKQGRRRSKECSKKFGGEGTCKKKRSKKTPANKKS